MKMNFQSVKRERERERERKKKHERAASLLLKILLLSSSACYSASRSDTKELFRVVHLLSTRKKRALRKNW